MEAGTNGTSRLARPEDPALLVRHGDAPLAARELEGHRVPGPDLLLHPGSARLGREGPASSRGRSGGAGRGVVSST